MHSLYLHYWEQKMNFSSWWWWWWWWCGLDKNAYWENYFCQLTLFSSQSFARSFWKMDQEYIHKYFAQSNIRFLLTPLNRSFLSPIFAYDCRISIGSRMELSNDLRSSCYLLITVVKCMNNEWMYEYIHTKPMTAKIKHSRFPRANECNNYIIPDIIIHNYQFYRNHV